MTESAAVMRKSAAHEGVVDQFSAVRRHLRFGVLAPNKPLTLLWALGRVERGEPRLASFADAEAELQPLLDAYGTPGSSPSYAFWRLQNDGVWEVVSTGPLPPRSGDKEPKATALRAYASGGFPASLYRRLSESQELRAEVTTLLRADALGAVPASSVPPLPPRSPAHEVVKRLMRQEAFRREVMTAFASRCVVCGWSLRHRGRAVGLIGAHVRPLGRRGPDGCGNGMVLCSLHHDLFDAGLFTYDERRRLIVSAALARAVGDLRPLWEHVGRPLLDPVDLRWRVRDVHLAWHRRHVFVG